MAKKPVEYKPPKAIFGEVKKKEDTKVVISLQPYGDKDYVDLREMWRPNDEIAAEMNIAPGTFVSSKHGFTISAEEPELTAEAIDQLVDALQKAKKYVLAGGEEEPKEK